jgi:hypothetical protein
MGKDAYSVDQSQSGVFFWHGEKFSVKCIWRKRTRKIVPTKNNLQMKDSSKVSTCVLPPFGVALGLTFWVKRKQVSIYIPVRLNASVLGETLWRSNGVYMYRTVALRERTRYVYSAPTSQGNCRQLPKRHWPHYDLGACCCDTTACTTWQKTDECVRPSYNELKFFAR